MKVSLNDKNPILTKLSNLQMNIADNVFSGNYKGFKSAMAEYSKFAVDHFDLAQDSFTVSVESDKFDFKKFKNMLKIAFLNIFRKKSPEEERLINMIDQYKIQKRMKIFKSNKP